MKIGQLILDTIIKSKLIAGVTGDEVSGYVIVWSANAESQLTELVKERLVRAKRVVDFWLDGGCEGPLEMGEVS